MNKKGVTIVELLGALVILGIVAALVSLLLSTLFQANDSINDEAKANIEATILISTINQVIDDFKPTDFSNCDINECVVLERTHAYIYDDVSTAIALEVYDPVQTLEIRFENNELLIDGEVYGLEYFGFQNDFSILTEIDASDHITITLLFTFVSEEETFPFTTSFAYDQTAIPGN